MSITTFAAGANAPSGTQAPGSEAPRRVAAARLRPTRGMLLGTGALVALLAAQWNGPNSVAMADGIAYITSGVNLLRTGGYTNAFGEAELWFPPLYPMLIGIASLGGLLDPVPVSRLISGAAAIAVLLLVWPALRNGETDDRLPLLSASLLASNPLFQQAGNASLSEASGTAFSFAAFAVWLTLNDGGARRCALFGFLVGAGYLVRPEAILLLPLLAAFDIGREGFRAARRKYAIASFACAIVAAPYVIWLTLQTGAVTLSNKSEVNVAAGRSHHYGTPREIIDPVSLEMRFYPHDLSRSDELGRYAANWARIGAAYAQIYRVPIGGGILVCCWLGLATLRRKTRLLWGLAAQCAYLTLLAVYAVNDRYLTATLPVLSVLAAYGLAATAGAWRSLRAPGRIAAAGLLIWTAVGLVEGGTRHPRWALTDGSPGTSILEEAGMWLQTAEPPGGVVYEDGATVGYYARRLRRRLTPDSLDTVLRYAKAHDGSQPAVWLALSSLQADAYHPTVRQLLRGDADPAALQRVAHFEDDRGKVVIFRVR